MVVATINRRCNCRASTSNLATLCQPAPREGASHRAIGSIGSDQRIHGMNEPARRVSATTPGSDRHKEGARLYAGESSLPLSIRRAAETKFVSVYIEARKLGTLRAAPGCTTVD